MTVGNGAAQLAYAETGSGAPLLLLHGIPGQAEVWRPVRARLGGDFRAIAPDLLGFGRSPAPADVYVDAQADAVARLLSRLGIEAMHIAAHDFGAPVAVTLLRRFPHLRPLSLVVAATNFFPDTPIPAPLQIAKFPGLRAILWPMLGTVIGASIMMKAGSGRKRQPYRLAAQSARSTYRIFVRSLSALAEIYGPIEESARRLQVPAAVLWGTKDPFFPIDVGRRTAEALRCELITLPGVGHFVPEEAPLEFAEAIRRTAMRGAR